MTYLLSNDKKTAVAVDIYYEDMSTCPRGAKCILLNEGGVAIIGTYDGRPGWTGWSPLPKRRRSDNAVAQRAAKPSDGATC